MTRHTGIDHGRKTERNRGRCRLGEKQRQEGGGGG